MEEQTEINNKGLGRLLLFAGILLASSALLLGLAAWRYELWLHELVTAAVVLVIFGGVYVWKIKEASKTRFFWLIGLHIFELAVIFAAYPAEGMLRPVLAVPVLIGMLAGMEAGMASLVLYSALSTVICADPTEVLLLYMLAGFIGVSLLSGKKKGKELLAGSIAFLGSYILLSMLFTVYAYMQLQLWDAVYSITGGFLQLLPICCLMPFLMEGGIRLPGVSGLSSIVSEDSPALVQLKERDSVLFKHSRLVARLSSQAAAEIGANALLAQAGGLYHEIGQGLGEDCEEESLRICKQYRVPASVQNIVKEYDSEKKTPSSREAAIVMLSDTIVSAMEKNRRKNAQGLDMTALIERVFQLRDSSGAFLLSGLTEEEISRLQAFYIRVLGRA